MQIRSNLPIFRDSLSALSAKVKQYKLLKMKSTGCPETSGTKSQTTLHNIPEDRRYRLLIGFYPGVWNVTGMNYLRMKICCTQTIGIIRQKFGREG